MDYFLKRCLAAARHFSPRMFLEEIPNDHHVFLSRNVSEETPGGWQEFLPWIISWKNA